MVAYASNASGNWGTGTIWTPNGVPTTADTVTITAGDTVDVDVSRGHGGMTLNGTLNFLATSGGGLLTFTNSGNVTALGTGKVTAGARPSTKWSAVAGDELSWEWTGNFALSYFTGFEMTLIGDPDFNEASDLDMTTCAGAVGTGQSQIVMSHDLGLRTGGGDIIMMGSDTDGWANGEILTTTAYNAGLMRITFTPTTANVHAAGTKMWNVRRQIRMKSSTTTRRGTIQPSFTSGTTDITSEQLYFKHVEFMHLGDATTLAPLKALYPVYALFHNCAIHQNREGLYLDNGNDFVFAETPDRGTGLVPRLYFQDTNFVYNDNVALRVFDWVGARFLRCGFMGERLMNVIASNGGFVGDFEECISTNCDRNFQMQQPCRFVCEWLGGEIEKLGTSGHLALTTVRDAFYIRHLIENALMDSSTDPINTGNNMGERSHIEIINRNQVVDANEMVKQTGIIYRDTTTLYAGSGASMRFEPSDANHYLFHTYRIPVLAGVEIKPAVWAMEATSFAGNSAMWVNGAGITPATVAHTAADGVWEELKITITPARSGFLTVRLGSRSATGATFPMHFDAPHYGT